MYEPQEYSKMKKDGSGNPQIKYDFYRDYFNSHFNLSFGIPKTDTCATCDELNVKLMMPVIRRKKRDSKLKNKPTFMQLKNFTQSCVHVLKWQEKVKTLPVLPLTLNRTCLSPIFLPIIFFTYVNFGYMCLEYTIAAAIMPLCMFGLNLLPVVAQTR